MPTNTEDQTTDTNTSTTPDPTPEVDTTDTTTEPQVTAGDVNLSQIVPGTVSGNTEMNIIDYSGQIAHDPQRAFSNEMLLGSNTPQYSQEQVDSGIVTNNPTTNPSEFNSDVSTVGTAAQADLVDPRNAVGYDAAQTAPAVAGNDMTAAQGSLSNGSIIEAPQIDVEAHAAGTTGVGQALNTAAILDLNDVDSRATLKGQIGLLQDEFTDKNGDPVIPPWASGLARNVSKIAAFKGITGSAATAAMSQALLEASIKVAEQDAKFFQTVSLTNLSNRQQATINRANVLAQMDIRNLDARTTAAVENAKNFMQMDLTNLSNEQQAAVINTQQRFQSILEDAKSENAARLFLAQNENEMGMFYDNLNAQMSQYNTTQQNAIAQFDVNQENTMGQFNSTLENQRDQFYRDMQYNIDIANARWRQTVATADTQMQFEAAAFDAKNMVDISTEQLNRLWDRADSLLDYVWKSTENQLDRDRAITIAQIQAKSQIEAVEANQPGFLDVLGNIAGTLLGRIFG